PSTPLSPFVSPPPRGGARPPITVVLWWLASWSRRLERDVEELGGRSPILEAFGNNAEGKRLAAGHRFITIPPVAQHAGQTGNLGDPATVFFAFEFDRESHVRNVRSRPGMHRLPLLPGGQVALRYHGQQAHAMRQRTSDASEPRERSGA